MLEDLFPQKPFYERIEFKGNLTKHNEVADGIHFVVQYPLTNQREIVEKAFGDKSVFRKLEHLFTLPEPLFKLESIKHKDLKREIYSEKVLIPKITGKGWPNGYGEGITAEVANLSFEDLHITEYFSPQATKERHLFFYLSGPQTFWSVSKSRVLFVDGHIETSVINSKIELNETFPFETIIVPYYFYDKGEGPGNYELTTDVLSIHFSTSYPLEELTTEEFLSSAKELTDDMILLISFISKRWITWFRYDLIINECLKTYVRRTRQCSTKKLDWDEGLVEPYKTREFLKTGLTNLRKLREKGLDLLMPITYYLSANEKTYLEEQFTTFFLSLERIKDMFAKEEKLEKNLPDKAFKRLHSSISDLVDSQVESSDVRDRVRTKILELNRPSLRYVLESLFSKYCITWEDLYPAAGSFTLIKTRDELFHSSRKIDMDSLVKERDRLQVLLERILLRLLGWEDLSRSPVDFIRRWLTAPLKKNQRDRKDNDLA